MFLEIQEQQDDILEIYKNGFKVRYVNTTQWIEVLRRSTQTSLDFIQTFYDFWETHFKLYRQVGMLDLYTVQAFQKQVDHVLNQ